MSVLKSTRVVVWLDNPYSKSLINPAIDSLGYERITHHQDGDSFVERVIADESVDLIICSSTVNKQCAVDRLLEIARHRTIPAVLVTSEGDLQFFEKALEDHVMGYLLEPIRAVEIRPTIMLVMKRFEEYKGLQEQVKELKESITERKTIERAKAVIMRRSNVDESEAYYRLRRIAMDSRSKIVEAADKVLFVEETAVQSSGKR